MKYEMEQVQHECVTKRKEREARKGDQKSFYSYLAYEKESGHEKPLWTMRRKSYAAYMGCMSSYAPYAG